MRLRVEFVYIFVHIYIPFLFYVRSALYKDIFHSWFATLLMQYCQCYCNAFVLLCFLLLSWNKLLNYWTINNTMHLWFAIYLENRLENITNYVKLHLRTVMYALEKGLFSDWTQKNLRFVRNRYELVTDSTNMERQL